LEYDGTLKWQYTIPSYGQSFRGAALADMNSDDTLDVVFGTSTGHLMVLNGSRGNLLFDIDLQAHMGTQDFEFDHGPVVADFDGDGHLDVFLVGGHAEYPAIENNYGRAYAVSFPSSTVGAYAKPWPMFRHDIRRSGSVYGNPVGITLKTEPLDDLNIWPNPSIGRIQIEGIGVHINNVTFRDLMGRIVFPESISNTESGIVSNWCHSGLYTATIHTQSHQQTLKFIIQSEY